MSDGWQRAYLLTLLMVLVFYVIALMMRAFGVDAAGATGGLGLAFGIAAGGAAFLLMRRGGMLAALPFFVLGCGIFFGIGNFLMSQEVALGSAPLIGDEAVGPALGQLNEIQFASVFVVLAVAGLFFWRLPQAARGATSGIDGFIDAALPYMFYGTLAFVPMIAIRVMQFPGTSSLILGTVLFFANMVILGVVIAGAARWRDISLFQRGMILAFVAASSALGLLELSKVAALFPLCALGLGWFVSGRHIVRSAVVFGIVIFLQFAVLSDLVGIARSHPSAEASNSIGDRITILVDSSDIAEELAEQGRVSITSGRLVLAPFSAYFINAYDTGSPGNSLDGAFVMLVPRILWPDKPLFTDGKDVFELFFGYASETYIAIGYVADSYWNYGWRGVLAVSVLIGLQIGWLTRKWLMFVRFGAAHVGAFVFSPAIVLTFVQVESSVVKSFIGGSIKMILLVFVADLAARVAIGWRARRRERMAPLGARVGAARAGE